MKYILTKKNYSYHQNKHLTHAIPNPLIQFSLSKISAPVCVHLCVFVFVLVGVERRVVFRRKISIIFISFCEAKSESKTFKQKKNQITEIENLSYSKAKNEQRTSSKRNQDKTDRKRKAFSAANSRNGHF